MTTLQAQVVVTQPCGAIDRTLRNIAEISAALWHVLYTLTQTAPPGTNPDTYTVIREMATNALNILTTVAATYALRDQLSQDNANAIADLMEQIRLRVLADTTADGVTPIVMDPGPSAAARNDYRDPTAILAQALHELRIHRNLQLDDKPDLAIPPQTRSQPFGPTLRSRIAPGATTPERRTLNRRNPLRTEPAFHAHDHANRAALRMLTELLTEMFRPAAAPDCDQNLWPDMAEIAIHILNTWLLIAEHIDQSTAIATPHQDKIATDAIPALGGIIDFWRDTLATPNPNVDVRKSGAVSQTDRNLRETLERFEATITRVMPGPFIPAPGLDQRIAEPLVRRRFTFRPSVPPLPPFARPRPESPMPPR